MKKITFDIMKYKDNNFIIETVEGYEIKIDNTIFGLYKNTEKDYKKNSKWFISDFKSGLYISKAETQEKAIQGAKDIIELFYKKVCEESYHESIEKFNQLKIDRDPYYYVVYSINKINTKETAIFFTYSDAQDYKSILLLNNTNIYIDKKLKAE
ncbi:hypothetical protein [Clostridium sp.]|uniref:hypothetical protein n=1 Tax=Clostridium sp. TaxID=1506 RepID=UPI00260FE344|nr:hypothetical protein [Clostridium sp.]